jgi:hypothetical protein
VCLEKPEHGSCEQARTEREQQCSDGASHVRFDGHAHSPDRKLTAITMPASPTRAGGGLAAATREFRDDGFAGGAITAVIAGGTQIAAGFGVALGLLTPLAGAGIIGVMTVAAKVKLTVGFWSQDGGYEYPLFLALLADPAGPGR